MTVQPAIRERGIPIGITFLLCILIAVSLTCGCLGDLTIPSLGTITLPASPSAADGKLRVYFLDVGQGDSAILLFGNRTVLIDAGERESGDEVVDDLRSLGVNRIDLLVATHPHSDHIGGMQDVLSAFPVTAVLDSGLPHTSSLYENFLAEIEERNINYSVARRGETINLDGLRILVLSPSEERTSDDLNDNSIILRISYGTVDFLFTGDAGEATERSLLKTGYTLDAEVLKVAHHGSSDATSKAFLSRVSPDIAVIPVGSDNEYGHPHDETLDLLETAGVTIYRTDTDGTVLVASDGATWSVMTTKGTDTPLTLAPLTVAPTPLTTFMEKINVSIPVIQIGNASFVSISETQFNAKGDDRLNLNGEWVMLENTGGEGVLLAGWTLTDETGGTLYTFPLFILDPGTTVTIYTGSGNYNDTALFMGRSEPVWSNGGDTAIIKDISGTVIDQQSEG